MSLECEIRTPKRVTENEDYCFYVVYEQLVFVSAVAYTYVRSEKLLPFRTDAVEVIKLTIRPIGRHHPRSSSIPHVDTGSTVSSIFGTLPGSSFLSQCQALSAIRAGSPQWYQSGV